MASQMSAAVGDNARNERTVYVAHRRSLAS